ncbi:hypothetical protein Tco_0945747 [Tanacetum coccineum]
MPILHSFEENKLEYEDEVEIKMMETKMDKESLEHNLQKNDLVLQEVTNGNLRARIFEERKKIFTEPGDSVRINPDAVARPATRKFDFI